MRVSPQNNKTFTSSKGYTITNPTINFEDSSKIRKQITRPIGVDESFYAIKFINSNAKSCYWFFPDKTSRDTEYDILDAITNFGGGANGTFPTDYSNSDNQLQTLSKLQALIDKPDYEILSKVGFDSDLLQGEKLGQITTSLFPGGGSSSTPPVINPINDTSFSWEVYDRHHWVIAPIEYNFSKTANVSIYFKFENIGNSIELNRTAFFLQYQDNQGNWIGSLSQFSGISIQKDKFEIIQFAFDNTTLKATSFRVIIQEFGLNNDSVYPSNFKVDFLGLADKNQSPITAYERYEDNMLVSTEYRDVFNNLHTLKGFFIPDTSEKIGQTIQAYLIGIQEQLEQLNSSILDKINRANDRKKRITYFDENDPNNRRPQAITYSSTALNLTLTKTFTYGGNSGNYYLIEENWS